MYCSKETVYAKCRTAPELYDFWVTMETFGPNNSTFHRIRSLSELNKTEISDLIGPMRDFLQGWVDSAYGKPMLINWSCAENMLKGLQ